MSPRPGCCDASTWDGWPGSSGGKAKEAELLPWKYVQPLPSDIDRFHGNVKLNISREKIADIHPADLADILEELSSDERVAIFDTLDTETAADTLEEAEPRVQRDLVASLRHDRIAELLQTMTPAQIADLLEILPRIDAEALRKTLPSETASKVSDMLHVHEVKLSRHCHRPGSSHFPPPPWSGTRSAGSAAKRPATTCSCTST